ncbi:MAG: hypothetical protein NVS9B10_03220 [Nevskia sp.]
MVTIVNGVREARRGRGRNGLLAVLAVALLVVGIWFLRRSPAAVAAAPAAAAAPLELAAADVAEVALLPLARTLPLSGSVQPVTQATVKSKVSGGVLKLFVREGQPVKRGMAMAQIDIRNAGPVHDSAAAALEKARADLAIAKLNYLNSQKLLEEKFVSQNSVDSTKAIYEAAQATQNSAAANLRLATVALEDATVAAPFDGIVARRLVEVGEKVSPDSAMFTIVDLSKMELDAPAPTAEIPAVKLGQAAKFRIDGFVDRVFTGTVWRINPVAEQGSRSIMIYLSVPNEDGALKGGMFAQGELALDAGAPVTAIPLSGLRSESGVDYAWVIHDGVVQRRDVSFGLKSPGAGLVEVRAGLAPGEQVVVARIDALKDGSRVKLAADAGPAPPAAAPDAQH